MCKASWAAPVFFHTAAEQKAARCGASCPDYFLTSLPGPCAVISSLARRGLVQSQKHQDTVLGVGGEVREGRGAVARKEKTSQELYKQVCPHSLGLGASSPPQPQSRPRGWLHPRLGLRK